MSSTMTLLETYIVQTGDLSMIKAHVSIRQDLCPALFAKTSPGVIADARQLPVGTKVEVYDDGGRTHLFATVDGVRYDLAKCSTGYSTASEHWFTQYWHVALLGLVGGWYLVQKYWR